MTGFAVERIEALALSGPPALAGHDLISPYAWRLDDGRFGLLARAVPRPGSGDPVTGRLWYGEGPDGLAFAMDERPVLVPDPDGPDACGCEDPTVVPLADEVLVYYSGLAADGADRLLWASGPHVRTLRKRGVALHSFPGERDVKEAEIIRRGNRWIIGYEYAQDGASRVGLAEGDGPTGPWRELDDGLSPRDGRWDGWHLSPGSLAPGETARRILFYNGGTRDGTWGIGWMTFDPDTHRLIDRSDEPLIGPPGEDGGRNIAFAASSIRVGDRIHLYLSFNDRTSHRAVLRQT